MYRNAFQSIVHLTLVFSVVAAAFLTTSHASGATEAEARMRIIVRLAPVPIAPTSLVARQTGRSDFDNRIQNLGITDVTSAIQLPRPSHSLASLAAEMRLADWAIVKVPAGSDPDAVIAVLRDSPDVESAEFDQVKHIAGVQLTPDDPDFSTHQYSLRNTGAQPPYDPGTLGADMEMEAAWEITTGDSSIIIAIIDTGIDFQHPEFAGRIWTNPGEGNEGFDLDSNGYIDDQHGYDFANSDAYPDDDHKHGSHCAGIAAASGNNGIGIAGINWQCKLMPVKVLNSQGSGFLTAIVNGITYAVNEGADVINLSIGGSGGALEETAINYALAAGVVVVAAMGNDDTSAPSFPAAYDSVIAVGATNSRDERAMGPLCPFTVLGSNYGPWIDVCAAGDVVWSTVPIENGSYDIYCLTSMSSPHVVGLASLILTLRPDYTVDSVRRLIQKSAEDQVGLPTEDTPGFDVYHGWGRINARIALQALAYDFSPEIAVPGAQNTQDGDTLRFTISATDSNFLPPAFALELPLANATLTDNGDGSAEFEWAPDATQRGSHVIGFVAFDGGLADTGTVAIQVHTGCNCDCLADLNCDGFIDSIDISEEIDVVFFGSEDLKDAICPFARADFNTDGFSDSVDLSLFIDHVFFGGNAAADPCAP